VLRFINNQTNQYMSEFLTYLQLGFEHISDIGAYDHMLFIVALCAIYRLAQWRSVAVLVTAFTVGHSVTLGLAAMDIIPVKTAVIEFLIPVTIVLTCLYNVTNYAANFDKKSLRIKYGLAAFFGLVHGMGFSNYFSMLMGKSQSIVKPLLAFNIGLEIGQLIIVAVLLGIAYFALNILNIKQREWNLFISGAVAGMALMLIFEAKFW